MRVLQGEHLGTLFHRDAHLWTLAREVSAREMAVAARECSRRLQVVSFCVSPTLQSYPLWSPITINSLRAQFLHPLLVCFPYISVWYIMKVVILTASVYYMDRFTAGPTI